MKKLVCVVIGVALSAPLSALANELETVIVGGIALGHRTVDSSESVNETETKPYELALKASLPITQNVSVQVDVFHEKFDEISNDSEDSQYNTAWNAHISYRNPEKFLAGVFTGRSHSGLNGDHAYAMDWSGIEGQLYHGDVTFYVQTSLGDVRKDDPFEDEGCNDCRLTRFELRYFHDEDLMFRVSQEYGQISSYIDSSDDGDISSLEISAEKRLLADLPLYGKAAFRYSDYSSKEESDSLDEQTYMVGVNYYFGAKSLKHNDRYGATLDLPMANTRANSWAEEID